MASSTLRGELLATRETYHQDIKRGRGHVRDVKKTSYNLLLQSQQACGRNGGNSGCCRDRENRFSAHMLTPFRPELWSKRKFKPGRANVLRQVDVVTQPTDDVVEVPSASDVPVVECVGACEKFRDDAPKGIERGAERRGHLTQENGPT